MIKTRAKYLITLCILLLSFSEQLVIHLSCENGCVSYQKIKKTTTSNKVSAGTQQSTLAFIFPSPVSGNRENILFDSDEKVEEDDEKNASTSSKKNLGTIQSLFTSLYNSYAKFFFLKNSQVLHFYENLSHFSHNKLFIVFQVFRI